MSTLEAPEGTDCNCAVAGCSCENDADLILQDGSGICGCCYAECPDVHDQRYVVVARAVLWSEGWELHVDGIGVTQVSDMSNARGQVRSLLESAEYPDAADVRVMVLRSATEQASDAEHPQWLLDLAARIAREEDR